MNPTPLQVTHNSMIMMRASANNLCCCCCCCCCCLTLFFFNRLFCWFLRRQLLAALQISELRQGVSEGLFSMYSGAVRRQIWLSDSNHINWYHFYSLFVGFHLTLCDRQLKCLLFIYRKQHTCIL